MNKHFYYQFPKPPQILDDYVEAIGMFHNASDEEIDVVVVPDGRIDLFFSKSASEPFHVTLIGLETFPKQRSILPQALTFVISFKPLAIEYILETSISPLLNTARNLAIDFWQFSSEDLMDFDAFYTKATAKLIAFLPKNLDKRKQKLFQLILASNGEKSVKELSAQVGWSSRQINRYFNRYLGVPLKSYCNILRFRASLEHIAHGNLFPDLHFFDQTHFVKEIKKFSGVVPKELSLNKNDRFILLSVLKQK